MAPLVCGTSHDVPEGPPRSIDYQMVEAPAGSRIEIGVLFLYTDHFTESQARQRVADWVRYANSLYGAGTSGVRLKSVGVRAAPRNVSRVALAEDDPANSSVLPVLEETQRSHGRLAPIRRELGGDLVFVMALGTGALAYLWTTDISPTVFRRFTYGAVGVGAAKRPAPSILRLEGNALAHEVGHLLGLAHDRANAGEDPEGLAQILFDPHAFGFLTPFEYPDGREAVAGTVMAISGPKLAGFSRPTGSLPVVGFKDIVLDAGDVTTNADRALRAVAATVAGFYDAPPPPDDDDDDDDGGGGGGGFTPPRAAIGTDAVCADGLCRAVTGAPIRFEDASTGSVQRRSWDFGEGSSRRATVNWSWSVPGFHEVTLRVSGGGRESTASLLFLVEAASPAGTCAAGAETLCLRDSRFSVEVEWWTASGERGAGRVVRRGTNDSGLFSFFGGGNWEMLIKVLDGCALNGHVWVFAALTTDLGYRIAVTDTVTGALKEYRNEPGSPAAAVTDATAFPEDCSVARL